MTEIWLPAPRRSDPEPGGRFGRATSIIERFGIIGYDASREVLAEPIEWLWKDIIATHHQVELSGPSATGKSTLAFLLAAARANPTGKPVELLGREVTPMPAGQFVLLVNEENGRQGAVAKVDAAIQIFGLPVRETWERIVLCSRQGMRATPTTNEGIRHPENLWAAISHAAKELKFGLLIFDTRARIFSAFGDSKGEEQSEVNAELTKLIESSGAPAIVVSHTRKGGGSDIEDVSGAGQRGAGPDCVLLISAERQDGRVLASKLVFAKLRDEVDEYPSPVVFSVTKDATSKQWSLTVGGGAKQGDPLHERVYEVIVRLGEANKTQIRDEAKCNSTALEPALSMLFKERRIGKKKGGKGGRQTDIFFAKKATSKETDDALPPGLVVSAHSTPLGVGDNEPF